MMLTGKALEDFEFWLFERQYTEEYYNRELISKTCLSALIIEWFDSVGTHIEILREDGFFTWVIGHHYDTPNSDTRQQAIEQAIIYANKLYNERS